MPENFVPAPPVRPYVLGTLPGSAGLAVRSSQLGGVRVADPEAALWLPSGLAMVTLRRVSWGFSPNRFAGARSLAEPRPARGESAAGARVLGFPVRSGGRHAAPRGRLSPA